jgi:hypothetical protein
MLISNKEYHAGDIILSATPFMFILSGKYRGRRCESCFAQTSSLKMCSGCKVFYYCSRSCQIKNWKAHHKYDECTVFKELATKNKKLAISTKPELLSIRVYLTLRAKPGLEEHKFELPNEITKSFNDLISHLEDVTQDKSRLKGMTIISSVMKNHLPDFDDDKWTLIFCKICTNGTDITDECGASLAHGLCIEYSHFNHSCRPNASSMTKGQTLEVKSLFDIKPGEEITISYIDLVQERHVRKNLLKSHWFFDCQCIRCTTNDDYLVQEVLELQTKMKLLAAKDHVDSDFEAYVLGQRLVKRLKCILGNYNILTSALLFDQVFFRVESHRKFDTRDDLDCLIKETDTALRVTHGKKHEMYTRFTQLVEMCSIPGFLEERALARSGITNVSKAF